MIDVGDFSDQAARLQREWETSQRWTGIQRDYSAEDVIRRRGPIAEDHAVARVAAQRLWGLLGREHAVHALGAVPGDQAGPVMGAGRQAICLPDGPARELNAFQLMEAMIEAGAAGAHFGDRLSPGHPAGDVLVPTGEHIKTLNAARLAADVLGVPAVIMARTCAHQASWLTSDADERDHEFLTGERTTAGLHRVQPGPYARVTRALAFAPYADLLWLETSTPDLAEARAFADLIYSQWPGKLLAYGCAPGFDWSGLDATAMARFQGALAAMGYRVQLMPPAGPLAPGTPIPAAREAARPGTHLAVSAV